MLKKLALATALSVFGALVVPVAASATGPEQGVDVGIDEVEVASEQAKAVINETEAVEVVEELLDMQPHLEVEGELPDLDVDVFDRVTVEAEIADVDVSLRRVSRSNSSKVKRSGSEASVGDTVVEGTADGFRLVEVIDSPDARHRFIYDIEVDGRRAKFFLQEDGSVIVGSGVEGNFEPYTQIAAPWAYDADGAVVPVRYETGRSGWRLVMVVEPGGGASYPVVADPTVRKSWWGKTYKFTRWEYENKIDPNLEVAAGVTALSGALCAASTAGICAVPWVTIAGIFALGKGVLGGCANSKGVDIHQSWSNPPAFWCSGY